MILILLGLPGSGKGTQGYLIAKELGIKHYSTGEILRKEIANGSELGARAKIYIDQGNLVPDDLINKFVANFLVQKSTNELIILDGYPRNIEQAMFLSSIYQNNILVINLVISREVAIDRIINRFSCSKCNSIYNKISHPPIIKGKCDNCGEESFKFRSDDQEKIINTRIDDFNQEYKLIVEFYQKYDQIYSIDATDDEKEIFEKITNIIKKT